jgi:hypothetical protein
LLEQGRVVSEQDLGAADMRILPRPGRMVIRDEGFLDSLGDTFSGSKIKAGK